MQDIKTSKGEEARETSSFPQKKKNLCIVVINPVSNRKAPPSSREGKQALFHRSFASQCGRSRHTQSAPQISTSFRIFNETLRRFHTFSFYDDEAHIIFLSIHGARPREITEALMLLKWAHFVVGGVLIVQITVLKSCGESNLIVRVSLDITSKLKLANPYFAPPSFSIS